MRERRRKGRGEERTGANSKMNEREESRREGEERRLASERRVDKRDEIDARGVATHMSWSSSVVPLSPPSSDMSVGVCSLE